jgi:FkbM family methyltransferase
MFVELLRIKRYKKYLTTAKAWFKNYLSSSILYLLWKKHLLKVSNIRIVCRDGHELSLSPRLYGIILGALANGVIRGIDCIHSKVIATTNLVLPIVEAEAIYLNALRLGWNFDGRYWTKGNVKFVHMYRSILEIFDYGEYAEIDVRGKDVVDVGAFVGDSAIYFALRGARRVVAVEPHPEAFNEMVENVKLNNLDDRVIMINAGLACEDGWICIEDVDEYQTLSSHHKVSKNGKCLRRVSALTLGNIIRDYGVGDSSVLKMDCEGCEHEVILCDYQSVRLFKEIILEYHGNPQQILGMLAKDYKCIALRKSKGQGLLYCKRVW